MPGEANRIPTVTKTESEGEEGSDSDFDTAFGIHEMSVIIISSNNVTNSQN